MPGRLGLLVNPTAGSGQGHLIGALLREALLPHTVVGDLCLVELSRATAADARAAAVQAVHSGEVDALAVVGGDGMVSLGLAAVTDTSIPLLVVPAGTGNDFARALGLPLPSEGAAAVVQAAAAACAGLADRDGTCRASPVDIAVASLADGRRIPVGCVLSVGFDAVVNAAANRMRWPRGPRRYELAVLRELPRFRPPTVTVLACGPDGEVELDRSLTLLAVANTPSYGGGLRIAPTASIADGLLDLVVVRALPRSLVLRLFPLVRSGRHMAHEAVEVLRVRSVVVRGLGAGAVYADGEELGELPVRLDVAPSAVRVLLPPAG